jgi:hypothetical protein
MKIKVKMSIDGDDIEKKMRIARGNEKVFIFLKLRM